ncbi:MAG: T9SS C-terminal target domain-containing protein [Calditrichaeota bacterium]|nr:MAG: T9SS C-terminal target domain-containing protein [Calditrichota bacterium]
MKKSAYFQIFILMFFFNTSLFSQNPSNEFKLAWETEFKTNHGYPNSHFTEIVLSDDGSIYATGNDFGEYGTSEAIIAKYDADGNLIWQQFFKGNGIFHAGIALHLDQATQELSVIIGEGDNTYGSSQFYLVKYSSTGALLFSKIMELEAVESHHIQEPLFDSNGNIYLLYGKRNSGTTQDGYLVKYSTEGDVLWRVAYGGADEKVGSNIYGLDSNDNIVISALITDSSIGNSTLLLYKLNQIGIMDWQIQKDFDNNIFYPHLKKITFDEDQNITVCWDISTYDEHSINVFSFDSTGAEKWTQQFIPEHTDEKIELRTAFQTQNGDLYLLGDIRSKGMQVIKYNKDGDQQWSRLLSHENWHSCWQATLVQDKNGKIIISGEAALFYSLSSPLTASFAYKIDKNGRIDGLFADSYNYTFGSSSQSCIKITNEGDVLTCGANAGQRIIKKYNATGQLVWHQKEGREIVTDDEFKAMVHTKDGETIILAQSSGDVVLTKCDSDGGVSWQTIYDTDNRGSTLHSYLAINSKGDIFITLIQGTDVEEFDHLLIKFNKNGAISGEYILQNARFWGVGKSILIDKNDCVYLLGSFGTVSNRQPALYKFDENGNEIWRFVNSPTEATCLEFESATLDLFSNIVILGTDMERCGLISSNRNITIIKLSSSGKKIWEKKWDGPENSTDWPQSLQTDHNGNIYFAVNSYMQDTGYTAGVIKLSPGGEKRWQYFDQTNVQGSKTVSDFKLDVFGNAILATWIGTIHKLNTDGDLVFKKIMFTDSSNFLGSSLAVDNFANIFLSGRISQYDETRYYSEYVQTNLLQLTPNGETVWMEQLPPQQRQPFVNQLEIPNNFYTISYRGEYGARHIVLHKYSPVVDSAATTGNEKIRLQSFPNPIRVATRIDYFLSQPDKVNIKIYDVLGREVTTIYKGEKEAGSYSVLWHPGNIADGNYFIVLKAGSKKDVCKVTYLK